MAGRQSILFVDAYDSFTRNIVALLYNCVPAADIVIIHNDTDVQRVYGLDLNIFVHGFDAIVLGPGPGDPRNQSDVGIFEDVLDIAAASRIPLLGICLGFQSLCLRYGHSITRLPVPCHGQTKYIRSFKSDIFKDLGYGSDVQMRNYNSLGVGRNELLTSDGASPPSSTATSSPASSSMCSLTSLRSFHASKPSELELLAWDDDGFAMAVRHPKLPLWGLQFHPESCMCYHGADLIKNWWSQAEPYISDRKSGNLRHGSIYTVRVPSQRLTQPPGTSLPHVKEPDRQCSKGKVIWTMSKFKSITSQRISKLCHSLTGRGVCAMFESAAKGRYSIYAFPEADADVFEYTQGKLLTRRGLSVYSQQPMSLQEALDKIKDRTNSRACNNGCPAVPFWGGWMGFCSYEMGLDLINVKSERRRTVPDVSFLFVERSIVFDQQRRNICVQSIKDDDEAWVMSMAQKLKEMDERVAQKHVQHESTSLREALDSVKISVPDHDDYVDRIRKCQEQLHTGNSYELCLTSEARISAPASKADTSYNLYQNLIKHNPVPFAAYLHFPDLTKGSLRSDDNPCSGTTILSTSPEQFLSWSRNGTLDMIPMKGTVQRTPTTSIDEVYRILGSPKETAENIMIADLIRHDLYGVVGCMPYPWRNEYDGSVYERYAALRTLPSQEDDDRHTIDDRVQNYEQQARDPVSIPALNSIKQFDTVYQLVSHIRANSPPHINESDPRSVIEHNHSSLHHVLPPGSMTGAPKKRSCEILQQLEQRSRGVYSGIIGYMDVGGGGCWSVAIRTAFSSGVEDYVVEKSVVVDGGDEELVELEKRKIWHVGAGGAVTVLSDMEGEWEEMVGKMNNVLNGFRVVKEEMPAWRPEVAQY